MKLYKTIILTSLFVLPGFISDLYSQEVSLDYYLPDGVTYNADIPEPKAFLGYEVGEWHARHDIIVNYLYALADASDRIEITEYGRTYEQRPLLLLTISSPENIRNIEQIRTNHLKLSDPDQSQNIDIENMPVVSWLGYSIHGDESSGANASLITAYHLAAAQGHEIEELLSNSVILLDPALNPDGLDRFANWVNMHKSAVMDSDRNHREHTGIWPGSRSNHYWFDLNRDWMPVQHPESRGRIAKYQHWKPNVLTDHHETSTDFTFFFQPGIPSRNNPLTPERNYELTHKLAEYHAEFLNEFGQLYWTKEFFDDYYLGKGSTYPDLQGTVAILMEQASSRGHLQESIHGDVSFPYTIRNQFITSLSTLTGALDLRIELHEFMRDFYITAMEEARESPVKAYVFGSEKDPARTWHLLDILKEHNIDIYRLAGEIEASGHRFDSEWSYIIPTDQPQYRFLTGLFETRTVFQDSLFYDISTWTLPLAFNLPYAELPARDYNATLLGDRISDPAFPAGKIYGKENAYAYVFEWHGYYAPRALNRLFNAGIRAKVSTRTFSANTKNGLKNFDYGTILISRGIQDRATPAEVYRILQTIAGEDAIDVFALDTGLNPEGVDLGSPTFSVAEKPKAMMIVGEGVNIEEAGEVWHLMDQRYKMNLTLADIRFFNTLVLDRYNTVIMVNGNYNGINENGINNLKSWVRNGGTLITYKNATRWVVDHDFTSSEFKNRPEDEFKSDEMWPYSEIRQTRGAQVIGGAIFEGQLDLSHPLAFGFEREFLPVFRNSTIMFETSDNPWSSPLRYTSDPLISGYISETNLDMLRNLSSLRTASLGNGRIIMMTDNPNFRGFWFGTNKLFANSLFFGRIISAVSAQ